jgi:hypothetical protein
MRWKSKDAIQNHQIFGFRLGQRSSFLLKHQWMVNLLFDSPISMKSKMMPVAALSVTEARLFATTCCAQDMLFGMRVLESMGLKVKKPMVLNVDNKGAKGICDMQQLEP